MKKIFLFFSAALIISAQLDYTNYSAFLSKYVNEKGFVDYASIASDKSVTEVVGEFENAQLNSLSENEKFAFLINAYNLAAIKNVVKHYPIDSPMDVDNFFKEKVIELNGTKYSLDEIEYDLIFAIDDIWVHFGIVCVAESCPKLLRQPYTGENAYQLLRENAEQFLSNENKNRVDHSGKKIYLSQIFRWFKTNFEKEYGTLSNFLGKYAPGSWTAEGDLSNYEIEFLDYNWSLNEQ